MLLIYAEQKNIINQTSNYNYLAVFDEEEQECKTAILIFFLRDFIFKKTLFEKLQYLKQE